MLIVIMVADNEIVIEDKLLNSLKKHNEILSALTSNVGVIADTLETIKNVLIRISQHREYNED